jgi:hypothetical protein
MTRAGKAGANMSERSGCSIHTAFAPFHNSEGNLLAPDSPNHLIADNEKTSNMEGNT